MYLPVGICTDIFAIGSNVYTGGGGVRAIICDAETCDFANSQ